MNAYCASHTVWLKFQLSFIYNGFYIGWVTYEIVFVFVVLREHQIGFPLCFIPHNVFKQVNIHSDTLLHRFTIIAVAHHRKKEQYKLNYKM